MAAASSNSFRISTRFAELRASGELGIVAYITAGDPSLDATLKFVLALAEAGADVIELGVPFSDPLADGPTIQRASERALKSGTTLAGVLELVRKCRWFSSATTIRFCRWGWRDLRLRRHQLARMAFLPPISRRKNLKNIAEFSLLIILTLFFLVRRLRRMNGLRKLRAARLGFFI
jgi:hypothetical protein